MQAINQTELLKSVSTDLYTDNIRFIYELIQNADDAKSTNIYLSILEDKYLIITHNGKVNSIYFFLCTSRVTNICFSAPTGIVNSRSRNRVIFSRPAQPDPGPTLIMITINPLSPGFF